MAVQNITNSIQTWSFALQAEQGVFPTKTRKTAGALNEFSSGTGHRIKSKETVVLPSCHVKDSVSTSAQFSASTSSASTSSFKPSPFQPRFQIARERAAKAIWNGRPCHGEGQRRVTYLKANWQLPRRIQTLAGRLGGATGELAPCPNHQSYSLCGPLV